MSAAFIHPLACVCGHVTLGSRVSIWPFAVLRGDSDAITVGDDSNIQDGAVVHTDERQPVRIGRRVGIGHRAIIHGCTIEDDVLVGMGAILLTGSHIGTGSIVAAGAVCTEGMTVPANSLVMGLPARVVRETRPAERERIAGTVAAYVALQERHRRGEFPRHE
jgi:carbonic anhydrase/acetyltransferase-like protein (isoleucine patch superfamily)